MLASNTRANTSSRSKINEIVEIGKRHRQLGLYLYLVYRYERAGSGAMLSELCNFYSRMVGRPVHEESVRRQLKLLMNKGLVREEGGKYYPVQVPLEVLEKLFDVKRARAGQAGAIRRLRQIIYENQLPAVKALPKSLKYYVETVVEETEKLVERGRREAALDLIVHTLLPVRETGVLWLWRGDEFIYYERKTMNEGIFHSVRFPLLSNLLKDLGFREGIMVEHLRGHDKAGDIIRKIFPRGFEAWPWARSIFYALKHLGLADEGGYYIVELKYENQTIYLYLRDYYNNLLKVYTASWECEELPPPLSVEEKRVLYPVLGVQHVKEENEESYFSRWG